MRIAILQPKGRVPRLHKSALADDRAQAATNCILGSGAIEPMRTPDLVQFSGIPVAGTIYRLESGGIDLWLAWSGDVDVAQIAMQGVTGGRIAYTGDGEPRTTDFATMQAAGSPYPGAWYVFGVTPPVTAPGVSHTGGTGTALTRSFAYTFVTNWNGLQEESARSPASAVTMGKTDGTWNISGMDAAPPNSYTITAASWLAGVLTLSCANTFGLRAGETLSLTGFAPAALNATFQVSGVGAPGFTVPLADNPGTITDGTGAAARVAPHNTVGMTKRLYWTEQTSVGTVWALVQDAIPVATTTAAIAGGTIATDTLPSEEWEMPPVDMAGILQLPNGITAGFSGSELVLSEIFRPHAYPLAYRVSFGFPIVGIGAIGQTIVVCTEGESFAVTGVDPSSMGGGSERIGEGWPCTSKRGIVSTPLGVMYPSPDGIVAAGAGPAQIVTRDLLDATEMAELFPDTWVAAYRDGIYHASWRDGLNSRIALFDFKDALGETDANLQVDDLWTDIATGRLYVSSSGNIYEWSLTGNIAATFDWLSREFVLPRPINPGAALVRADFGVSIEEQLAAEIERLATVLLNEAIIAAEATNSAMGNQELGEYEIGGDTLFALPGDLSTLTFQVYADGVLKASRSIREVRPFRLPKGYTSDRLEFRVSGNVPAVTEILVAETMKNLRDSP